MPVSAPIHSAHEFVAHVRALGIPCDEDRLLRAYETAESMYADKPHWTGVNVFEHVLGVLSILLPFQPDEDAIVACLLHHALQTKKYTLNDLEEQFGLTVKSLVSSVHLFSHVTLRGRRTSIEDLRLMLLTVSDDVRTVLITLCDRLSILLQVHLLPKEERSRMCHDVLQLFAPVAARLGMYKMKHQLESLAFPVVYPSDAERIHEQRQQMEKDLGRFIERTADSIRAYLAEQGITAEIEWREKHPYSIFSKMRRKSISHIEELHDLYALRVVVSSEEECYRALGILHRLGRPVSNRFKDYIAFPKPNGYQSLHTTLAQLPHMPNDIFVEVQVRTKAMHRDAKYGVAAHWSYKEGGSAAKAMHELQVQKMLSTQESLEGDGKEGHLGLVDHIFVLTPRGDVVELPEGATPLDFAFQVHSDLGLSFHSARVNGSVVPLDYQLENGDVIEIHKYKIPRPSPQWMQLLKMASSRSKLKKYLHSHNREELIDRGRSLLNAELEKHRLSPLDADLSILKSMEGSRLTVAQREDVLVKLGQAAEKPVTILPQLDALKGISFTAQKKRVITIHRSQRKDSVIAIEGGVPMPIRYAKCCKPNEGAKGEISGVINRAGEVMVHRTQCRMIQSSNPQRRVEVWWREQA